MHQPSGSTGYGLISPRHTGISSVPINPILTDISESISSTSTITSSVGPVQQHENGNLFTLTNIYTFGDRANTNTNPPAEKYNIKSFVEVFHPPVPEQQIEYERNYNELHSSSSTSSVKRLMRLSSNDTRDYDPSRFNYRQKSRERSLTATGS